MGAWIRGSCAPGGVSARKLKYFEPHAVLHQTACWYGLWDPCGPLFQPFCSPEPQTKICPFFPPPPSDRPTYAFNFLYLPRNYPYQPNARCFAEPRKVVAWKAPFGLWFSACRTAVRRYLRPARAGSAAAITPSAPVMLHVLSASTQLGAHRRPACTTQHVRYR